MNYVKPHIQLIQTIAIYIFSLGCLIELKFCEVSRNSFSNRSWKFQLSILKNKKVLFLKKNIFLAVVSKHAKIIPKDGASRPNFQWRFWKEQLKITLTNIVVTNHFSLRVFEFVLTSSRRAKWACLKLLNQLML